MTTILTSGSFDSKGVSVNIPIPSDADYFVVQNITQSGAQQTPGRGVKFEWFGNPLMADGSAMEWKKKDASDDLSLVNITTGGFTYIKDYPIVEPQAASAITAITNANPAVVTQNNSYSNGDVIRIYGTTGMLTVGGIDVQISSVSGTGYTLLGLPATATNGFAAAATAGHTRRISKYLAVEPQYLYVTGISQAKQAVVSLSVDPANYYAVGMKMHFSVPASFGMTQINQMTGKIVAVNAVAAAGDIGAYNITVDIDSSSFSAFSWPASASSPTAKLFATVSPAGASTQYNPVTMTTTGYNFDLQPFRTSVFVPYMHLAAGAQSPAGSSGDKIWWAAYKMTSTLIV